jgi:hypothetical protein
VCLIRRRFGIAGISSQVGGSVYEIISRAIGQWGDFLESERNLGVKNRNTISGYSPFDNQRKARTGDASSPGAVVPPKPKFKLSSFQEVMYPKANMPARPRRAVTPSKLARPKPEPKPESRPGPKLSFQESLYPKANMPAPPRRSAQPPEPANPQPEPKLSFQESLVEQYAKPAAAFVIE